MAETNDVDFERSEVFGNEDIYDEGIIQDYVDDDEISSEENGFMQGYLVS